MFNKITSVALIALALQCLPQTSRAESPDDILIIANKGLDASIITLDELKQIFLGKKRSWRGGDRIVCLNQYENKPIRETFREHVLHMNRNEEKTYWENQKVRRQLTPPPELTSIPKAVFKLKNAISYAYRKDVPENVVKVLLVIENAEKISDDRQADTGNSPLFGMERITVF